MKRSNKTLRFVYGIALAIILLVIVNVFLVTIGKYHLRSGTSLDSYLESVSTVNETIYAQRGKIFDTNGEVVAQDTTTYDIICYLSKDRKGNGNTPAYIDDPLYTAKALSIILGMDESTVFRYLSQEGLYQTELGPLGRNLSEETKNEILSYPGIHGIGFKESSKRVYPKKDDFAPYLIGFAQSNEKGKVIGKMGLEAYLNDELSGTDGSHIYQMSKQGYILPGMYEEYHQETNGLDVYTTIDTSIQEALADSFDEIVTKNNASKAWGSVVEINTGKILAWGQTPGFDPNELEIEDYLNTGTQFPYEPGSVFKSIIYSAAMDLGVYNGDATFNSETYCFSSHGNTPYRTFSSDNYGCITNAAGKSWGEISFDYGLIYSSNVATMTLLEQYVGTQNFIDYVIKFGFFQNVETDGIEEVRGVKNYFYPAEKLSLTFGQGSSVTMLQLIQAYTAIFGNGEMLKPYYIDKIVDPETNEIVYQGQRTVVGSPIKEETARKMQQLLARVVSDKVGTAKPYGIEEVNIMAKTGTSEISLIGQGYSSTDSITSVMMAFPAENPKYMLYYAYVSPYDYYNHLNSSVINELTKRVVILTNSGVSPIQVNEKKYETYTMENLTNISVDEAVEKLNDKAVEIIIVGNGEQVIGQYPKETSTYYSNSKVFLKTNGNEIVIPDFKGWTRKDVVTYWNLSGIPIVIDGYGVVYEQSIMPYSIVNSDDELILYLYDIKTDNEENLDSSLQE